MELLKLAGIGLVLGITTVTPGVSVGTIAVVLNVYDRLIEVITLNIRKLAATWKFWLPLGIGIVAGIITFSKVITFLLEKYPTPAYWFFIGIIIGCIPQVYRRVMRPGSVLPSLPSAVSCLIALAVMAVTAALKLTEESTVYTVLTPALFGTLTAAGALAAIAMIIPGISGTFLLLVIGLYRTFVQAVSDLNFLLLIPVAIGAGIGLFAGAALVRFLLTKAPRVTYGAVLGLVAGSVIVLFPGGIGSGVIAIFSVASVLAGGALSFLLGRQTRE
jgi:putative membrane protein